ncbi:hypothetical protein MAR_011910 [Mya arenaria]|uniref:Uncharacterized protein n=1 Tax=Mya arenaria TaxID=6604 RepID=A0ABY7FZF4_MYAAR|nr:uncharacterized protein LOC128218041 [Mya arenaria]WAR26206.1 hypothetical protein MAR_011910 [Mya arenaria]
MTMDLHALQRQYASLRKKQKKHTQVIIRESVKDVKESSMLTNQLASSPLATKTEVKTIIDPITIATISMDTGTSSNAFLDSITPQVVGDTKCILVQQAKHKDRKKHKHHETHGGNTTEPTHTDYEGLLRNLKLEMASSRKVRGRSLSVPSAIKEENEYSEDAKVSDERKTSVDNSSGVTYGKTCQLTLKSLSLSDIPSSKDKAAEEHTIKSENISAKTEEINGNPSNINTEVDNVCNANDSIEKHVMAEQKPDGRVNTEQDETKNTTSSVFSGIEAINDGSMCKQKPSGRLLYNGKFPLPKRLQRSMSANLESTLRKTGLKVNPEIKANIYHHFYTKKRHLSADLGLSAYIDDNTHKIMNPFPVQHWNENRFKAGMKLGLYKQRKSSDSKL